jgi:hypothetical protein
MICSQCGNDVAEGAAACPRCGAPMAASQPPGVRFGPAAGAPAGPAWSPPAPAPAAPAFGLDMRRLTRVDRIVGGASLVFIVSLFLPWFTSSADGISGSVDGLWHGYMYLGLILALAILGYLVIRAGFEQMPFQLPLDHERLLLAATAVVFVLTVISFVFQPSGDGIVSIGWGFGAFVGLIAAIVAVAPLGLPFLRSRTGR